MPGSIYIPVASAEGSQNRPMLPACASRPRCCHLVASFDPSTSLSCQRARMIDCQAPLIGLLQNTMHKWLATERQIKRMAHLHTSACISTHKNYGGECHQLATVHPPLGKPAPSRAVPCSPFAPPQTVRAPSHPLPMCGAHGGRGRAHDGGRAPAGGGGAQPRA